MSLHRLGFHFSVAAHSPRRLHCHGLSPKCLLRYRRYREDAGRRPWTAAAISGDKPDGPGSASTFAARVSLPSSAHTAALGRLLAANACRGDVLCLRGDLAAGKTTLARAYVRAARKDPFLDVTSPTYTLVNSYPATTHKDRGASDQCEQDAGDGDNSGVPDIYHMDLWRLRDATERNIVDFGYVYAEHIAIVEWPDRLGTLTPASRLDVYLQFGDDGVKAQAESASSMGGESEDFWRFPDDEGEGHSDLASGRAAVLVPHGEKWHGRVQALLSADAVFAQHSQEYDVPHLRFSIHQDAVP